MFRKNLSEAMKKRIAGRQKHRCANKPGSKLRYLEDYECPQWKLDDGVFDEAGCEIDHDLEVSMGGDNSEKNLQALCLMCHGVKTKNFLMDKNARYQRKRDEEKNKMKKLNVESDKAKKNGILDGDYISNDDTKNTEIGIKDPKPLLFGCDIDIDKFTKEDIEEAAIDHKGAGVGLIRLFHFNPKFPEYHNVYASSKAGDFCVLTKYGVEHVDYAVGSLINELAKYISIILGKYDDLKNKFKIKCVLEFTDRHTKKTGADREIFHRECDDLYKNIRMLLFDQKKMIMRYIGRFI